MQTAKKEQEEEPREYGNIRTHPESRQEAHDQDFSQSEEDVAAIKNSSSNARHVLDTIESTSGPQADQERTTPETTERNEHVDKARDCERDTNDKMTTTGKGLETSPVEASADDSYEMPEPKVDGSHVIKPWDIRPDPLSNDRMAKLEAFGSARNSTSRSASARPPTPRFLRLKPLSTEITDAEAASIEQAVFRGKLAARRNAATNLEEDVARLAIKLGDKAPRKVALWKTGKDRNPSAKRFGKFFCCTSGSNSPSPTRSPHPKCRNEVTIRVRTRRPPVTTSSTASPLLTSPVDVEIFENSIFSQEEDPATKILAITESNASSAPSLRGFVNHASEEVDDKIGPKEQNLLEQEDNIGESLANKTDSDDVEDDGEGIYVNMRSVGDGAEAENPVIPESSEETTSSPVETEMNSRSRAAESPDNAAGNTDHNTTGCTGQDHEDEGDVFNAREHENIKELMSERPIKTSEVSVDFLDIKADAKSRSLFYLESHLGNVSYEYDISKIRLAELCSRLLKEIAKTGTVGTEPPVYILTPGPVPKQSTSATEPATADVSEEHPLQLAQQERERKEGPGAETTSTESPASRKTTPVAEKVASYITFSVPRSSPRHRDAIKKRETPVSPMQTPLSRFASRGRVQQQWSRQTEDKVDSIGRHQQFLTRQYPRQPISTSASMFKSTVNNFPSKPLGSQLQKLSSRSTTSLVGHQTSLKNAFIDKLKNFKVETPSVPGESLASRMKIPLCLTPDWECSSSREAMNVGKSQSTEDVSKMVQHLDKLASKFCSLSSIPSNGTEARKSPETRSSWRRSNRASLTSQSDNNPGPSWSKYPRYNNGVVDRKACRSVAEKIISFEEASLHQPAAKRLSLGDVSRKPPELGAPPPSKYFESAQCKLKSTENVRNLW